MSMTDSWSMLSGGVLLVLFSACSGEPPTVVFERASLELRVVGSRVLDPKLEGDAATSVEVSLIEAPDGQSCEISMRAAHAGGAEESWALGPAMMGDVLTTEWDGYQDEGLPFDPGPVQLIATASCEGGAVASSSTITWIVRLGIVEADFVAHPDSADHVPLAFHKLSFVEGGVSVIDAAIPDYRVVLTGGPALADLDQDNGEPRAAVTPWLNPDVPPWGAGSADESVHNLPVGYVAGGLGRVVVTPGAYAMSPTLGVPVSARGPRGAEAPPAIRVLADGLTAADDAAPFVPGEPLAFDFEVPGMMGRHEIELRWHYQAELDGAWQDIPGEHRTTHRVYTFAAQPPLRDGTDLGMAPAVPWIGALEQMNEAISGLPPEVGPLLDAVRDYLHFNRYVIYNPSDGAYSRYEGRYIYWDYTWSELSRWLDRDDGIDLYCHSMSCLLSVLAGMVGVGAPQQVLGVGFRTNLTRAAGTEGWRTWGFNSHSFVSPDDGATFWDASIDLDGDGDPSAEPVTPLAPKGLSRDDYLGRLVLSGDVDIVNAGYCYFR